MKGQVVYMYAYDVAYEIDLQKIRQVLTERAQFLEVKPGKTMPRDFPFYKPLLIEKQSLEVKSSVGPLTLKREAKIFSIGALTISISVDFEVSTLPELLRYHAVQVGDGKTIDDVAGELCEQIYASIRPHVTKPAPEKGNPEAYTVFCLYDLGPGHLALPASVWLADQRREVAGLLTEEKEFHKLSEAELGETLRYSYSYTNEDMIILDWNSALIVDPERKWDDLLYIIEVANVQLTELSLYDRMLEAFLDRAYDDIEAYSRKPPLLKGPGPMVGRLKEVLMDLTKMSEEITNITKFFGDWHLARIYMACSERFHLKEWENSVEEKLRTIDGLYNLVREDMNTRRMLLLEAAIVLLFVVDLLSLILKR